MSFFKKGESPYRCLGPWTGLKTVIKIGKHFPPLKIFADEKSVARKKPVFQIAISST